MRTYAAFHGRIGGQLGLPKEDVVQGPRLVAHPVDLLERRQGGPVVGNPIKDSAEALGSQGRVAQAQGSVRDGPIQAKLDGLVQHIGRDLAIKSDDLGRLVRSHQTFVRIE